LKKKVNYVCDCGHQVDQIESYEDLAFNNIPIPYEWWLIKETTLFNKWDIYYCDNCKIIFRKRKLLKYYLDKIRRWFKT
jgi:hypothetical protein